jgi:hypothetical protein
MIIPIERASPDYGYSKSKTLRHAKQQTKIAASPGNANVQQKRSKPACNQIYKRILKK